MIYRLLKNLIAIIALVLMPGVLLSDKIPKELEGFWSGNSCMFSEEDFALYIGKGGYLYEDDQDVEFNFVNASTNNGWTHLYNNELITDGPPDNGNYNYFYKLDGDKLIEKLPPYDWDGKDYSFLTSLVVEPNIYTKCKDKDPVIESKYGEALSLLDSSVARDCSSDNSNRGPCLYSVFKFLDVNKDSELHSAEITRGLRTLSLITILVSQNSEKDTKKDGTFGIYLATVPFIPLFTQTLMANIDYNGSKSLSLNEISQDRSDLFSAIFSAKGRVIDEIQGAPEFLENLLAPLLLQGLSGLD